MPHHAGFLSTGEPDPATACTWSNIRHNTEGTASVAGDLFALRAPLCFETGEIGVSVTGAAIWRGQTLHSDNSANLLNEIVEAYRDTGRSVLRELFGPFALVIVDSASRRAMLAIDRMGIERMAYATNSNTIAFGSSVTDVARLSGKALAVRNQAIYDYLFMHMVAAPNSVYEGIFKLPPATVLEFDRDGVNVESYWQPSYDYAAESDFPALKTELFDSIRRGIAECRPDAHTGTFLSGGLDSSGIAGAFSQLSDTSVRTFTVGFGETDYDELKYARSANRAFGCDAHEYQMTAADIVHAFPKIAETYDEPFGNSSAAPTYLCALTAARNGVTHLLAGDGGDELFGGNERYTRQAIFQSYYRIPSWIRRGLIEPTARLIDPESRIVPLRKARSYVDQATIPLPDRFESWNFMYREGRHTMLDSDFHASVNPDSPLELMREVWDESASDDLLEQMLRYDWKFTLADNDLRKVSTMSELAGVRVSYPLLQQGVVDLSTRVPPQMKIRGKHLRHFYKLAMTGFLPDDIINKPKHGFGLPFGIWLKEDTQLAELIYGHLRSLKSRHIIATRVLDDLVDSHRSGHASYYGYAIWDLAMLDAWLAHHVDRRGG